MSQVNSLLTSLFRNNSGTRSSSLFTNNFIKSAQNRTRSQSNYKTSNKNLYKYTPLCDVFHTFTIKLKKLSYQFFCKLQTYNKKIIIEQRQSIKHINHQKILKLEQGFVKLSDSINIIDYKINLRQSIPQTFKKFKQNKIIKKLPNLIQKLINQQVHLKKKQFFINFITLNQLSLKFDVLEYSIKNVIKNTIQESYYKIYKYGQKNQKQINCFNLCQYKLQSIIQQQSFDSFNDIIKQTNLQTRKCSPIKIQKNNQGSQTHRKRSRNQNLINQHICSCFSTERYTSQQTPSLHYNYQINHHKDQFKQLKQADKIHIKIQQARKMPKISPALKQLPSLSQQKSLTYGLKSIENTQNVTKLHYLYPERKFQQIPDLNDNRVFNSNRPSIFNNPIHKIENNIPNQNYSKKLQRINNLSNFLYCNQQYQQTLKASNCSSKKLLTQSQLSNNTKTIQNISTNNFQEIDKIVNNFQKIKQKSLKKVLQNNNPQKHNRVTVNLQSSKKHNNKKQTHGTLSENNSLKKNWKLQKQNMQVKLWQEKDKLFFYPKQRSGKILLNQKIKKKNSTPIINNQDYCHKNVLTDQNHRINLQNNHKIKTSLKQLKLVFDRKIKQ